MAAELPDVYVLETPSLGKQGPIYPVGGKNVVDDLVTQGGRSSASIILTYCLLENTPVSAPEDLKDVIGISENVKTTLL